MNNSEKDKTFKITRNIEILVWVVIILLCVMGVKIQALHEEKLNNNYVIFLPDVDGLIVGSPVRMMGIEIGYVTKIEPTNEEVYVKFLINDRSMKVPRGTQATVEFSGMAGSKSLELYLPDSDSYIDNTTPIITVNPPKRLHDAFSLLNEMFEKIGAIIKTSSYFGKNIKEIEDTMGKPKTSEEDIHEFVKYTNNLLDDTTIKAEELGRKLEKYEYK